MQKNAILNTVSLVAMLAANTLANALPINGLNTGQVSERYSNLFVPAGFTFGIWGLIYLLLIGLVGNGFLKKKNAETDTYGQIGWLFAASCVLNGAWIFAWHYLQIGLSVGLMLALLGVLIALYLRLDIGKTHVSTRERIFVHIPISIYLGWISVATIANVAAFCVAQGWLVGSPNEVLITQGMMGAATLLALLMLFSRTDFGYSLVVIWALFGIWSKKQAGNLPSDYTLSLTAWVTIGIIGLFLIWHVWDAWKRSR